jgi:F0F1-type ATP synthase assembly protein I
MARRTIGENVDELLKVTTIHEVQLTQFEKKSEQLEIKLKDLESKLAELQRRVESELKLLNHQVEDLRKTTERTGQRLWMVLAPIISGVLVGVIIYFLGIKK